VQIAKKPRAIDLRDERDGENVVEHGRHLAAGLDTTPVIYLYLGRFGHWIRGGRRATARRDRTARRAQAFMPGVQSASAEGRF
jgi:hypothetical protein